MITLTISGSVPSGVSSKHLKGVIETVFSITRRKSEGVVSVCFVSDKEIRDLNTCYRHRPRATDVLSFSPLSFPKKRSLQQEKEWGDIFIAATFAAREAKRRGIPISEEIFRLVAHGMLHLLGYDHVTDEQEFRMFTLQERAVSRVLEKI